MQQQVRLISSFNWIVGTLLLLIAVAYPFLDSTLGVGGDKKNAEAQVAVIVETQRKLYFPRHESFAYFSHQKMQQGFNELSLNMPAISHKFKYEAVSDGHSGVIVRAIAKERFVKKGDLSPLLYEYTLPLDGNGSGHW